MFCPSCGKQIPDGSVFCPVCGATLSGSAPASAVTSAPGPQQSFRSFLSKGGTFASGLTKSPVSIAVALVLFLLIIFMFQPWTKFGDDAIDYYGSSSDYYVINELVDYGTDSQMDQWTGALNDSLTMPFLSTVATGTFQIVNDYGNTQSIIALFIPREPDQIGALAVFAQIACWLFLVLWIISVVFLAMAIVSNLQGSRRGRSRALSALIMTAATSVLWIIVVFILNGVLVGKIKDYVESLSYGSVDDIPGFIIVPSAWTWVIAVMAILGLVGLMVLSTYLRTGKTPFSSMAPQYPGSHGGTYVGAGQAGGHSMNQAGGRGYGYPTNGYPAAGNPSGGYPASGNPGGTYPSHSAGGYYGSAPRRN